jgi:hypothetical protein
MTVLQKTINDIVQMWERTEKMHPIPHFSVEWAIKKPGEDKALLGIVRRADNRAEGKYTYEVWEVS